MSKRKVLAGVLFAAAVVSVVTAGAGREVRAQAPPPPMADPPTLEWATGFPVDHSVIPPKSKAEGRVDCAVKVFGGSTPKQGGAEQTYWITSVTFVAIDPTPKIEGDHTFYLHPAVAVGVKTDDVTEGGRSKEVWQCHFGGLPPCQYTIFVYVQLTNRFDDGPDKHVLQEQASITPEPWLTGNCLAWPAETTWHADPTLDAVAGLVLKPKVVNWEWPGGTYDTPETTTIPVFVRVYGPDGVLRIAGIRIAEWQSVGQLVPHWLATQPLPDDLKPPANNQGVSIRADTIHMDRNQPNPICRPPAPYMFTPMFNAYTLNFGN